MGVPAQRVDALLEFVGLDETAAGRRVGKYSLGVRQRLGFAHALLGEPEVLILNRARQWPRGGSMRWMRGLLRNFAEPQQQQLLLSSHLLAEVEAVADRLRMIGGGRIQAQGGPPSCSPRPRPLGRGGRPRLRSTPRFNAPA